MKIVTSLSFKGECREAFDFYARVLGGKVTAAYPFGDGPPDMPIDAKYKDWLMHCWLDVGDQSIMGADIPPEFGPNIDKPKNGFDVTLHTEDAAQADGYKVEKRYFRLSLYYTFLHFLALLVQHWMGGW